MNKRSTKWYRKNEEEVIKRLGLKPTRNSGATWIEKADGQNEHFICELKSTDHESFTIKQSVLHTLEAHAIEAHKIPVFAFQFINHDEVWVALKESDIEAYKALIKQEVIEELKQEMFHKNIHKNIVEKELLGLCNFNENEIVLKKILDKGLDKRYNKGEKEKGGWLEEPMLELNTSILSQNNINTEQDIDIETNKCSVNNSINKNKLKKNINARNKYRTLKQTEFEENETKRKERNKEWKRNLNKKE